MRGCVRAEALEKQYLRQLIFSVHSGGATFEESACVECYECECCGCLAYPVNHKVLTLHLASCSLHHVP